ncbi:unnamed protein product [Parnassius apollo]|uniref:(apollo) hypothetical protein n=1 Tax=Parnassius apollo TaxID=110799 RepID=A0A8S3XD80_PARAO|nr:unnamed protein product [Parnassius apollo]
MKRRSAIEASAKHFNGTQKSHHQFVFDTKRHVRMIDRLYPDDVTEERRPLQTAIKQKSARDGRKRAKGGVEEARSLMGYDDEPLVSFTAHLVVG